MLALLIGSAVIGAGSVFVYSTLASGSAAASVASTVTTNGMLSSAAPQIARMGGQVLVNQIALWAARIGITSSITIGASMFYQNLMASKKK